MKARIPIFCVAVLLAFMAGRMSHSSPGEVEATAKGKHTEVATKFAGRPAATGRRSKETKPGNWKQLKERAAARPEDLLDELGASLNSRSYLMPGNEDWLAEYLLWLDPKGTYRTLKKEVGEDGLRNLISRWCIDDPENALEVLTAEWKAEKFDRSGSSRFDGPFNLMGMGRKDPEKGLAIIMDLPADRRLPSFFTSLLAGISVSAPDQTFGYFEKMLETGSLKEGSLREAITSVAFAQPEKALAWAEEHYHPVPDWIKSELLRGVASSDIKTAMRLYTESPPKDPSEQRQAAFWIANNLARNHDDLDSSWGWLEANVPPDKIEELKGNALSAWAFTHPSEAAERILSDPELLAGPRGGEMIQLMKSQGRAEELATMASGLEESQKAKVMPILTAAGLVEDSPGDIASGERLLLRMARDPENTRALWDSFDAEKKGQLLSQFVDYSGSSQDPAMILDLMSAVPSLLGGPGGRAALARLSLTNPAQAAKIAETVPLDANRVEAINAVYYNWREDDPPAAEEWKKRVGPGN